MKIAVLGAGAMGSIYGGHLSLHNDVYMIDKKQEIVDKINADGLKLFENDKDVIYRPEAMTDSVNLGEVDLVILFVKALFSKAALEENRHIIGEHTYVMTLQNGAGHEDILSEFVPKERIIIGTTEDNGAVLDFGYVRRGGKGKTNIGMLVPDSNGMLGKISLSNGYNISYIADNRCSYRCSNRSFISSFNDMHDSSKCFLCNFSTENIRRFEFIFTYSHSIFYSCR